MKNYREMCKLLGEDIKSGRGKVCQINGWECYFKFKQEGHKYIILDIFDKPKLKVDNSIYIRFLELLLMYELSDKEKYTCEYTKTNLFYILGMVNQYYLKNNRYLVKDEINYIPSWQINHFYMRSNSKLTNILFSVLNSMKKRRLLSYYEIKIICENNEQRIANDIEEKQILRIERDVLISMGYEKIPFMKIDEYYNNINIRLKEVYGWDCAYKEYKLIYNSDQIYDDIPIVRDKFMAIIKKNQLGLNNKILEALNKQAEYYYKKNCEMYKKAFKGIIDEEWECEHFIDYENKMAIPGIFNYPPDYIENQKALIDIFLSIH